MWEKIIEKLFTISLINFFEKKIKEFYNKIINKNNILILLSNFKVNWELNNDCKLEVELRQKIKDYLNWKEILWKKIKIINYTFEKLSDFLNIENLSKENQAEFFIKWNIITEGWNEVLITIWSSFNTESKKEEDESKYKKINIKNYEYKFSSLAPNKEELKEFWYNINILLEFSLEPYKRSDIINLLDKEDIEDGDYEWIVEFQKILKDVKKYNRSKKNDELNQKLEDEYKKNLSSSFEILLSKIKNDNYKIIVIMEYIEFLSDFNDKKSYKYVNSLFNECIKKSIEDKYLYVAENLFYKSNYYIENENKSWLVSLKNEIIDFISKNYSNISINIKLIILLSHIAEIEYIQDKKNYNDFINEVSNYYSKIMDYFERNNHKLFFEKLEFLKNIKYRYLDYNLILKIFSIFPIKEYISFLKLNKWNKKTLKQFYYDRVFWVDDFEEYFLIFLFLHLSQKNEILENINLIYKCKISEYEILSTKDTKKSLISNFKDKERLLREIGIFTYRLWEKLPIKTNSYNLYENKIESLFLYLNRDLDKQKDLKLIFEKLSEKNLTNYSDNFNLWCYLFNIWEIEDSKLFLNNATNSINNIVFPILDIYSVGIIYTEFLNSKNQNKYDNLFLIIYILKNYQQFWTESFYNEIYYPFIKNTNNNLLKNEAIIIEQNLKEKSLIIIDNIEKINLDNPFKFEAKFSKKFTMIFLLFSFIIWTTLLFLIIKLNYNL